MESKKVLYGWLTTLPDGHETLIGCLVDGSHTPLIASSLKTMEGFRPIAVGHAKAMNQPLRLVRFQEVETLERYDDGKKTAAH